MLPQNKLHAVVGDCNVDTVPRGHFGDGGLRFSLAAGDNLAAAMRDDGTGHVFLLAPGELRFDRGMSDEPAAAPPHEWALQRCAVADIQLHASQRGGSIVDINYVGRIKDRNLPA